MSTALVTLTNNLASRLGMADCGSEVLPILKATAFKGSATDAQLTALMIVANQYGLNPWTKEIYAFPDKNNGIVPVVGVDGWSRIINEHPQLDGIEFEYGEQKGDHFEWIECLIYRKDRSKPVRVREFWDEVARNTGPWQSHKNRMHRHKALIQSARLAFGFAGIYDQDEAERIIEINPVERKSGQQVAESVRPGATIEHEDNAARESLIADLEIVAKEQGIDAYAEAWGKLTAEQRRIVGADEHARLKSIANHAEVPNE